MTRESQEPKESPESQEPQEYILLSTLDQELSIQSNPPIQPISSQLFSDSYLHVNTGILETDSLDELTLESLQNKSILEQDQEELSLVSKKEEYKEMEYINWENQNLSNLNQMSGYYSCLKSINISYNPCVTDISPLCESKLLTSINASYCGIINIPFILKTNLIHLQSLLLKGNQLTNLRPSLSKSLKVLDVSDNQITHLQGLEECNELTDLNINHNLVIEFGLFLRIIKRLKRLESLDTRWNPMTESFYPPREFPRGEEESPLSTPDYVKKICYKSLLIHLFVKTIKRLDGMELNQEDFIKSKSRIIKFKKAMSVPLDEEGCTTEGLNGYMEESHMKEGMNGYMEESHMKEGMDGYMEEIPIKEMHKEQLQMHRITSFELVEFKRGFIRIPKQSLEP